MNNLDTRKVEKLIKKQKANKKKGRFSKFIVVLVILLNVIFTTGIFYVFTKVGSEPSTLIVSWFGFTTAELWSLSKIKRGENK
jgi:hypothetical protein